MAEIVERPQPSKAQEIARRFFRHENVVLLSILAVIIAALAVMTGGKSISALNVKNVLFQISSRGIASVGQMLVILTAGIDLTVGGLATLCVCLGGALIVGKYTPPMAIGIVMAIMLLIGAGIGSINGSLVSRLGMPPLIVTIAMWWITLGGALSITYEELAIRITSPVMVFLGRGSIAGVPAPLIIFIVVAVVAYYVLNYTTFGRSVYATGGNEISAWLCGINTKNIKLLVYMISGFLAALAGMILMARSLTASVAGIGGLELDTIGAVCIGGVSLAGGRGTLIGMIIGVVILGVISNGLNLMGVSPFLRDIIRGVIIIIAVAIDTIRRR